MSEIGLLTEAKRFSSTFAEELQQLFALRRDVRRFKPDPVPEPLMEACLASIPLAPSVGLSEPWRIVRIESKAAKKAALTNFQTANAEALQGFSGEKARAYADLKLSGMQDAPIQLAIFCDDETPKGAGLGVATMPEMRAYSVVGSIMHLWLTARTHGLGMGWVSILDPAQLSEDLGINPAWPLIAYLCIGWPEEESLTPELQTAGWETRTPPKVITR